MSRTIAKLGAAEVVDCAPPRLLSVEPPEAFDREFRNEVTDLVHEILRECYVTDRGPRQAEARRWGLTLEQLVAATVSQSVMRKVDNEYL